jgi:hypothetical protein
MHCHRRGRPECNVNRLVSARDELTSLTAGRCFDVNMGGRGIAAGGSHYPEMFWSRPATYWRALSCA